MGLDGLGSGESVEGELRPFVLGVRMSAGGKTGFLFAR